MDTMIFDKTRAILSRVQCWLIIESLPRGRNLLLFLRCGLVNYIAGANGLPVGAGSDRSPVKRRQFGPFGVTFITCWALTLALCTPKTGVPWLYRSAQDRRQPPPAYECTSSPSSLRKHSGHP